MFICYLKSSNRHPKSSAIPVKTEFYFSLFTQGGVMPKKMTLFDLVRQECCNFVSDECLGIELFSNKRFKEEGGKCWIIDEGTQCDFFVRCVLPLASELKEKYVALTIHVLDDAHKAEKKCNCGGAIPKGKQLCSKCRKRNRKKTDRENHQKYRARCHTIL